MTTPRFHIPFVRYQIPLVLASVFAVFASWFIIATHGFNYGIDFKGGAKLEYQFQKDIAEGDVVHALEPLHLGDISVIRYGTVAEHRMSIKVTVPEEHAKIGPMITAALEDAFGKETLTLEQETTVGPKVGKELQKKAWFTILVSWLLMLIYIGYRFDFFYAPGAVLALIHDVSITLGFFSLLGKEINLSILAAILTLIGYSNNDTIVVFDRIRENSSRITPATLGDVVNESLNSTLSRTLITSLTVLFVVVVLFFMGGGTLHDFAFALIIGTVIGTYSSLFVATPYYMWSYTFWPRLQKLWVKK